MDEAGIGKFEIVDRGFVMIDFRSKINSTRPVEMGEEDVLRFCHLANACLMLCISGAAPCETRAAPSLFTNRYVQMA